MSATVSPPPERSSGDTVPGPPTPGPRSLWKHSDFLKLWVAQTISAFGNQITLVALPLAAALVLDASPAQMGYLTAAGTLPSLLFGLVAGVVVDRLDRRKIMIITDVLRAALIAVIPAVWIGDALTVEVLYVVAFGAGIASVFFRVAEVSFLPTIVLRHQLVEGNSKLQASQSVAQVGGPGIAGVLVAVLTAPIAIFVDAVSFLVSGFFIRLINPDNIEKESEKPAQSALKEAWEGVHTVFRQPILRALTLTASTTSVFGWAFLAVYILFLADDLELGPGAIGLVLSLGGIGALIGAIAARPLADRIGIGRAIIFGQVMFGLFGMVIPVAVYFPSYALYLVLVSEFTQWMMIVLADVNSISLRQSVTPNRLLGRVAATHHMLVAGFIPIGALIGGWIGEIFSVQTTLVVGVFGMLAASLWLTFSPVRSVRSTDDSDEFVRTARDDHGTETVADQT